MHAHFRTHRYHRHSHDTYSFGVTESGAQAFTCRGAGRVSATGMVMVFNPDEPHDGHAATAPGFTYRMLHIGVEPVRAVLAGAAASGLPLFTEPVVHDAVLATALRGLHAALLGGAGALERDERLAAAIELLAGRAAYTSTAPAPPAGARAVAARARDVLRDDFATDLAADELAHRSGCSRYALYRAFRASYGVSPSDYRRLLRLRAARRLLARGRSASQVAADVGFADQAHLTRWFVRSYGITPGRYARAAA